MTAPASRKSVLLPVAFVLFAAGILAVVADFGLFATGHENQPVWLNLACLLAPLGFAVALVGTIAQARRDRKR